ncbi:hypothetical protein HPB50_006901 [Hyalomma asiaticum]|uniref:Uncharacterized protein n=1 Tax=Hyalomma asiaticum TaxID=266040 RepID=A0ACB7RI32_HYAAI|nr:hypothetical protein HPB50_006901 [Hyalomma asiaticum]
MGAYHTGRMLNQAADTLGRHQFKARGEFNSKEDVPTYSVLGRIGAAVHKQTTTRLWSRRHHDDKAEALSAQFCSAAADFRDSLPTSCHSDYERPTIPTTTRHLNPHMAMPNFSTCTLRNYSTCERATACMILPPMSNALHGKASLVVVTPPQTSSLAELLQTRSQTSTFNSSVASPARQQFALP